MSPRRDWVLRPPRNLRRSLDEHRVVAFLWGAVDAVSGVLQHRLDLGDISGRRRRPDAADRGVHDGDQYRAHQDNGDDDLDEREPAIGARRVDVVFTILSADHSKIHCLPPGVRQMGMTSPCLNELSVQFRGGLSENPSRFGHLIRKSSRRSRRRRSLYRLLTSATYLVAETHGKYACHPMW